MKSLVFATFVAVATLLAVESNAADAEKKPWLDMQGCSICKHMGANMDLMQHVTWETHKIPTGMVSISTVAPKHKAKMDEIHKKMKGVIAEVQTGKQMPLCGMCSSYGDLVAAGAEMAEIETKEGVMVGTWTATDAAAIKKIHAHADKTVAAFKELMAGAAQ